MARALEAEAALARETTREARQEGLRLLVSTTSQNADTVRRSLSALDYLRGEASRLGIALEKVALPLSSVETLRRISSLDRRAAERLMGEALEGRLTYHKLLEEKDRLIRLRLPRTSEGMQLSRDEARRMVCRIEGIAAEDLIEREEHPGSNYLRPSDELFTSKTSVAVFFHATATSVPHAVSLDGIALQLLASLQFYDTTYYVAEDDRDFDFFTRMLGETRRRSDERLILLRSAWLRQSAILKAIDVKRIREMAKKGG